MKKIKSPWAWVPSLYFAEGIPYIIVMTVSVIMYKRLGISNTDIALYTSWLYLPWVIKPFWSPIVDLLKTKRYWIIAMQLIIGAGLGGVALTIPLPGFFQYTLMFFWLIAFSSATHDIAADGFYMLGLDEHEQAFFVGIRSTFYRFAMITGQGLLIILAGYLESNTGLPAEEVLIKTTAGNYRGIDNKNFNYENEFYELSSKNIFIDLNKINQNKFDSIKTFVLKNNISNGFSKGKISNNKSVLNKKNELSGFEKFIKENFGEEVKKIKKGDLVGNYGILKLKLKKKITSDDKIVFNISKSSGSNDIKIVEGSRLEFNTNNADKEALVLFQIDPKLRKEVTAEFSITSGNISLAWSITFSILAVMFFVFFIYHKFILPKPVSDKPNIKGENVLKEFINTFIMFFKKKNIGLIITFLMVYRLGESQLVKLASPFLLDSKEAGGLALSTGEVGFIYGTIGLLALTLGGIIGGILASRDGLKKWLWWMIIAINLPNAVYIFLSYNLPESFTLISMAVAVEQFGYGFGFTAYMLYMIYISDGEYKTAHFAITTGFMALGMMIPGMISGWLQELIGYKHFFIWVLLVTIPAFVVAKFIEIDPLYGKKKKQGA